MLLLVTMHTGIPLLRAVMATHGPLLQTRTFVAEVRARIVKWPVLHLHHTYIPALCSPRLAGTTSGSTPRGGVWCAGGQGASLPSHSWRSTWGRYTAPGGGLRSRWVSHPYVEKDMASNHDA